MSQPIVTTSGKGIDQLRKYFQLFDGDFGYGSLKHQSKWVNGATYDAPHGFVTVQRDGNWMAECTYSSVQFCKNQPDRDGEPDVAMKNAPEELARIIRAHLNLPDICVQIHR